MTGINHCGYVSDEACQPTILMGFICGLVAGDDSSILRNVDILYEQVVCAFKHLTQICRKTHLQVTHVTSGFPYKRNLYIECM